MQLILDTPHIVVQKRNNSFFLKTDKHQRLISPERISSIMVLSQCMLSTSAIRLAVRHNIPIYLIDAYGNVEAQFWSASFGHLSTFRRKQVLFYGTIHATQWVIGLFSLKTQHQIENLNFLKNRKIAQYQLIEKAIVQIETQSSGFEQFKDDRISDCSAELMGNEGILARYYWEALAACMPTGMNFETRNRQPPQDNFNAALNYLYGMLYTLVETAIFSVGLDPYLGFLHADQYDKPTLSYDLIEPFRPWAERLLIDLILANALSPECFEASPKQDGIWLSRKGKEIIIPAFNACFNEKCVFDQRVISRRAHINQFAFKLVKLLDDFSPPNY